jgi:hypothetical protein
MQYLAAAGSKACNRRVEVRPFLCARSTSVRR